MQEVWVVWLGAVVASHEVNAEDRAAARGRCEAATEGPWRVMTETRGGRLLPFAVDAKHLTWRVSTVVGAEVNPADAEFIAHARTDLTAALTALDAVEKERDALKAAVEAVRALHQPKRDDPMSLIQHTFCSCGAMEVSIASDGYPAIGPAAYPCATLRALVSVEEGTEL